MDPLSLLGLVMGVGAIIAGNWLEGGHLGSLLQPTALLIVIGGTVGATLLQTPVNVFFSSLKCLRWVLLPPRLNMEDSIARVVEWSNVARKEGLLGLEAIAEAEEDLFIRRGLDLLVDGSEPEMIKTIMETESYQREQHDLQSARVYEAMGGYSPTIGILGAVMGLIHVMENLSDPSKLGAGIAVAFVATIYGVGLANLVLLPVGNKIKSVAYRYNQQRELITEGIVSISQGDNPRYIEMKLQGYQT